MMGKSHVLSGAVAGAVSGHLALRLGVAGSAELAGFAAGLRALATPMRPRERRHRWWRHRSHHRAPAWWRKAGHHADVLGIAAAALVAYRAGPAVLWLVVWGCGIGCTAHLLGDACTNEGIPVAWPWTVAHVRVLPEPLAFTTGTLPERWVAMPALVLALAFLVWRATGIPVPHMTHGHLAL